MKFIALILVPVFSFGQSQLDTVTILKGKVKILVPKELSSMTDQMWNVKYQNRVRPTMVLSDEDGEVNLMADITPMFATEDQIEAFKNSRLNELKGMRPDLNFLSDGVMTVNSKKIGYFKFITQAVDQKVFNYHCFCVVDGKILLLVFNCIEKLRKRWEGKADDIMASLTIN